MTRRSAFPLVSFLLCAGCLCGAWLVARAPGRAPHRPEHNDFRADLAGPPEARLRGPSLAHEPQIRVGLRESPVERCTLEVAGPFRIESIAARKVLKKGNSLEAVSVRASGDGFLVGDSKLGSADVEIIAERDPAIWVDGHRYRGTVRLYRRPGGKLLPVNVLPLEHYIASVVDSEMPAAFPEQARQAQAIVARTYAVYQQRQAPRAAVVDLFASTRSQKYLGFQYRAGNGKLLAGESESSRQATRSTRGQVGTFEGEVFCTYYCACCGGRTVAGRGIFADAAPPLQSVPCGWCQDAKLYRWQVEVSKRQAQPLLRATLAKEGKRLGTLKNVSAVKGGKSVSGAEFEIQDERQAHRVSGSLVRQALGSKGLHSPQFNVTDQGETLTFDGRGHGHGVGLCQWGARGLAKEGKTARQIFAHYYVGAKIIALGYP